MSDQTSYSENVDKALDAACPFVSLHQDDIDTQLLVLALLDQMGFDREVTQVARLMDWDEAEALLMRKVPDPKG